MTIERLDVDANRRAAKWSRRALVGRALWEALHWLFAWSPRPLWGWRNMLLRLFGARIGRHVHVHPSVRIAVPWNLSIGDYAAVGDHAILYSLGSISIGRDACISQYAHICAGSHDYERRDLPLTKPPISIGSGAWICASAFVGPGVEIGNHAILAAASVAVSDIAPGAIHGGNPAQFIKMRPAFIS